MRRNRHQAIIWQHGRALAGVCAGPRSRSPSPSAMAPDSPVQCSALRRSARFLNPVAVCTLSGTASAGSLAGPRSIMIARREAYSGP